MEYTQLKVSNLNIVGQEGLCLAYVTEVFSVPNYYPSATVAWQSAQYKHPSEQPPTDVAVPVWFSYNGPDGHVAVSVPGKGIYSTSAQGDKVFTSVAALVSWMGEGMTYLGWSEDINNVSVVQGVDMKPTRNQILLAYQLAFGPNNPQGTPTEAQIEAQLGQPDLSHVLSSLQGDSAKAWAATQSAGTVLAPGKYIVS